MSIAFPEPTTPVADRREVLLGYLAYFRSVVAEKLTGLPDEALRTSLLASGWTPIELVHHLVHVERRWLVWGFEGEDVEDPWGDAVDGRWAVPDDLGLGDLLALQRAQSLRTEAVVRAHGLDDVGRPSERWDGAEPPTLERVLLHLVQEHARHAGHLDVVRELLDGRVGE